ncbi:MAG: 4Fe4S-binding leucine-rich repeat protein [Methylococcaceae bacterium]
MMKTDIDESRDWQGQLISCVGCEREVAQAEGHCQSGHACVHDRYARRIDRFFRWNPDLARDYLKHPYFEVRAVAAKYVEVFLLPQLLADPDETVRQSVALRLPIHSRYLLELRQDPHREVRVRVAERLGIKDLPSMIGDSDYFVRQIVARRLPVGFLPKMMHDPDPEVRKVLARRISLEHLPGLARDEELSVRLEALRRMTPSQLLAFRTDLDWRVRYEVASRLEPAELGDLCFDPDEAVRELSRMRQTEAADSLNLTSTEEPNHG